MTLDEADRNATLLSKCVLFQALDRENRLRLAKYCYPTAYQSGEVILRAGDEGRSMMAIVSGTVRLTLPLEDGKEIIIGDKKSGDIIGEMSVIDGESRSATAHAITKCQMLCLDRRHVVPFLESHPSVCMSLLALLCRKIRQSDQMMIELGFIELPVRLARALLKLTTEGLSATNKISFSQAELANMIGGRRENVVNRYAQGMGEVGSC